MGKYSKLNRDRNEPLITAIIKRFHIPYLQLSLDAGADLLLLTNPVIFVEVKNPESRKDGRKLTETERAMQEICKERSILYYIVEYSDQMADILSAHFQGGGK